MADTPPPFDPSKPFTVAPAPVAPKFDPSKPYTGKDAATPPVEAPPFMQGVGTGLADKFYGAAQFGAHMADVPLMSPEMPIVPAGQTPTQDFGKAVDTQVQQREKQLEKEGYNKGWGRTVGGILGDVAATAPLIALGPGGGAAGLAARVGAGVVQGAAGGAISGLVTPETSGHFETGKAGQLVRGGVEGGVGGGTLGALSKVIGLGSAEDAEAFIKNAYTRSVRPSVAGKSSFAQQTAAYDKARDAISEIVRLKPALALTDTETGEKVVGELPKSVAQFGEAVDQAKRSVFAQYDAMAKNAEGAATGRNTTVPRFQKEFADASREQTAASRAVQAAERQMLQATAQQARAGENVYLSSTANEARREAQKTLDAAQKQLDKAQVAKASAYKKMGGVWVDLGPVVSELRGVGRSTLKELDPRTVAFANRLADRLSEKAAYSPLEAQEAIQNLNARLSNFYKQPTKNGTSEAAIEAMVANKLREGTDTAINEVTGQDYQSLKNAYGALRSIEKDVVHRALVQGRNTKGGLTGMLLDIATADQVIHAIAHLDPTAIGSAAGWQVFKAVRERMVSPNRAVRRMFETAERLEKPQTGGARENLTYAVRRIIPPAGAAIGYQSPQHSALGVQ